MIDKPKGKLERFLEGIFDWCQYLADDAGEVLQAGYEPIEAQKKAHPIAAKVVISTLCILICGLVIVGFATPKTVIVKIDDSRALLTTIYETTSTRVDSLIENHNIDYVAGEDLIDVEMHDGISDDMVINIIKAYDVTVEVDGETYKYRTLPTTAGEVLDALEITLGENDLINFELDDNVRMNDQIVIKRVSMEYITEEVKTDYEVKYIANSSMAIGSTEVGQKGQKGLQKKTYLVTYVDGEEAERILTESETIKEKKDKIIYYGTKILKGKPAGLQYVEKITDVRAVSYHFSGNPKGVYGLECTYGTCAVSRDLIPLGSLLYVEGYGYAIANDVGSSIEGKTIDLYMEKRSQCGIWGARWTTVYVIKYGDDTRYWER